MIEYLVLFERKTSYHTSPCYMTYPPSFSGGREFQGVGTVHGSAPHDRPHWVSPGRRSALACVIVLPSIPSNKRRTRFDIPGIGLVKELCLEELEPKPKHVETKIDHPETCE